MLSKKETIRSIKVGNKLFLLLLFIDYIYTLFFKVEIDIEGVYNSLLGLTITQEVTPDYFASSFGFQPRIFISYIIIILFVYISMLYIKKNKKWYL